MESNIKLAKDELESARKAISVAKERRDSIMALTKQESAFNLYMEDNYAAGVIITEHKEKNAAHFLELGESKKKVLEEYTKPVTNQKLNSAVEMARSNELAMQAAWDLEQTKLLKAKRSIERDRSYLPDVQKRILALVQLAFPIQEAIEAKLDQLVKGRKPDDSLQASLRNLTNQLDSLVEQAEGERAAVRFAKLIPQVQREARSLSRPGRPRP